MKKYGLRIGNTGVEFISQDEREKALRDFTKGVDVIISSVGLRYKEGEGSFSVYERDTKEILTNCEVCKGVFGIDSCGEREYPEKAFYATEYRKETGYICDACLARAVKAEGLFEAKKKVAESE